MLDHVKILDEKYKPELARIYGELVATLEIDLRDSM